MSLTLIFASDPKGIIGNNGRLPWPTLKGELKRFKETTMWGTVVMGRNTFQSLPKGPLFGRHNIILTKNITLQDRWKAFKFNLENFFNRTSLEFKTDFKKIFEKSKSNQLDEIFIIGGASIYKQFEQHCDRMIWTKVKEHYDGDTKFIPSQVIWQKISEEDCPEYSILTFRKKR